MSSNGRHVEETLDPADWDAMTRLGHRMVDDMMSHTQSLRERAVWRSPPDEVRARLAMPLPRGS